MRDLLSKGRLEMKNLSFTFNYLPHRTSLLSRKDGIAIDLLEYAVGKALATLIDNSLSNS